MSTSTERLAEFGFTPAKDPSSIVTVGGPGLTAWAKQRGLTAAAVDFAEGSMIALYPTGYEAEALAVDGGQPADTLHVTLAFLPTPPQDPEALAAALSTLALWVAPLEGTVGGLGMFAEGHDGVPVVALPDVVGLNELRAAVVAVLEEMGVEYATNHGFSPHITLGYGDTAASPEALGIPLTFSAVSLVVGLERWDLPLGAAVTAPEAVEAAGNPYHEAAGSPIGGRFAHRPGGALPPVPQGWGLGDDLRFKQNQEVGRPGGVEQAPVVADRAAREILQGTKDTQQLYGGPMFGYTVDRVANVQNPIIQHYIGGHQPSAEPTTLFMAGGSGSGKSSILQDLSADVLPADAVMVNSDLVKEKLPEYDRIKESGSEYASAAVHEESSDVSKRLLNQVNGRGLNAIVDGTGDSAPGKFMGKINEQVAAGRQVKVVMVDIPTDEAIARADARAARTGRYVPHDVIRENHQGVAVNHLDWRDKVDNWEVWANDNGPGGRRVIARRVAGGPIEVLDEDRYQQALDKANPVPPSSPGLRGLFRRRR